MLPNTVLRCISIFCVGLGLLSSLKGQTTSFTYQGNLQRNGSPVSGNYDLTFALFNTPSGGTQISSALTNTAVLVTNGLFTVILDFGSSFPGSDRWLEIGVRATGDPAFFTLAPRQILTPVPYAITASGLSTPLLVTQLNGVFSPSQSGSLTNHNDVSVAALAAGNVLTYSGSVWTNGPGINPGNSPSASNNVPVTLSFSGTNVAVNAALGTHFRLLATNSFLLQNPVGVSDAQRIIFEIIQDTTGGRSISLGSSFKLGTDLPVIFLSTNANSRDFISCVYSGTNFYVLGFVKGF